MGEIKTYIARFKLRLRSPIAVAEKSFPELHVKLSGQDLKEILVRVSPAGGVIHELDVEATYSDESLFHLTVGGQPEEAGIKVMGKAGGLLPPWEIAHNLLRPILYYISGATMQANVFWDFDENLAKWINDFNWILPGGRTVPSMTQDYPIQVIRNLTNSGERQLELKDWSDIQQGLNGSVLPLPLWRSILAEAHRDRSDDFRNVVIHCATALDVGAQPLLPKDQKFDMKLLRGECSWARTPDLRSRDSKLYGTLSQLWYTRHGIVHRGESNLYDTNPITGAKPLRAMTAQDVEEFLIAVPQGVAFLETNPP